MTFCQIFAKIILAIFLRKKIFWKVYNENMFKRGENAQNNLKIFVVFQKHGYILATFLRRQKIW
jgi:hypothetical protein